MSDREHSVAVARSRAVLLEEIGEGHDLVFVRGHGNIGDELIWAGTRRLLEEHVYREISIEDLPSSSGEVALLSGGGAWCRPYCEFMPRALAIAELRFDRVIVLPSSFDVGEDSVRAALMRTQATVFAREQSSFEAVAGLCRARAAHDCSFFYDFSGYSAAGTGTLNAFRTDREATEGELQVEGNDDISVRCGTLEEWLETIACHALVRTDRAHVMIAAALMGKEVEFAPSSYHKLPAIADWSLRPFAVRRIPSPRAPAPEGDAHRRVAVQVREQWRTAAPPPPAATFGGSARVTAVILSHDRPELVAAAVRSVTASVTPVAVLVIDNNSTLPTRRVLAELAAEDPRVKLRLADRNLGAAGARRLAIELVDTEVVLFLDDDTELLPWALEHLLADLEAHPHAAGVTGVVVSANGVVHHYGGSMAVSEEMVAFTLDCGGLSFEDSSMPPTGPTGWAPGTAALLRVEMLRQFPIDEEMSPCYEDNEWCHRVETARPGSFRRCREAVVLHDRTAEGSSVSAMADCGMKMERLLAQAHFLRTHGRLLDVDLLGLVPELRRADGSLDTDTARLLLGLIAARGTDWATMAWCNGELEPLLGRARMGEELERAKAQASAHEAALATLPILQQRHETLLRVEAGGWWQLRARLLPLLRFASVLRGLANPRS